MTLTQINKAGLDELALDHVFTIGASGSSAYTFQGEGLNGTVNNPTLYLTRGKTYRFENGTGAHPIRIQSTSGASGTAYNTGVTNNAGSGTVIVEVQHDAPDVLYYQCTSHAAMNGILYITGALADGGVTTAKIADDAVTTAKIADFNITTAKLATNSVDHAKIVDSNVTTAKIQNSAVTTAKIADQAVTLAKLPHGDGSSNGKFLRANNGADPTFETVNTDLVADTSPQLGGTLDANGQHITIQDSPGGTSNSRLKIGNGDDLQIFHNGTNSIISNGTGDLSIRSGNNIVFMDNTADETFAKFVDNGAVELYWDNAKKFETYQYGIRTTQNIDIGTHAYFGDNGEAIFGAGSDLKIYHDGTNNYIQGNNQKTIIRNTSNNIHIQAVSGEGGIDVLPNGAVKLYYDNSNKLQTNSQGFALMDDSSTRLSFTYSNSLAFITANAGNEIKVSCGNGNSNGIEFWDYTGVNKRCQIDAEGIKFNTDTAAANGLDDYEEGTWTVGNISGLGGTNTTANTSTYVKIGHIVHITLNIFTASNNMSFSNVTLSGLPYTVKDHQGIFVGGYNNKDCSGAYINSTGIVIMSGGSGIRHLWTHFSYEIA